MSSYKSQYKTNGEVLEQKYKEEKRVPIQGRVNIIDLSKCAYYFKEKGVNPSSRSELLAMIVEGMSGLLEMNDKTMPIESAGMAYRVLDKMGIGWDEGTRAHKRVMKVLEAESISMDGFDNGTSQDEMERLVRQQMKKMQSEQDKKDEKSGEIAGKIPQSMLAQDDNE